MARTFLVLGALNGFLAVALGAFGAHGLQHRIAPELLDVFQTGVQYHGLHVPALLATALLMLQHQSKPLIWGGVLFLLGIALFSGSLYLLAITGFRQLGVITPFGGLALLLGWLALAFSSLGLDTRKHGA